MSSHFDLPTPAKNHKRLARHFAVRLLILCLGVALLAWAGDARAMPSRAEDALPIPTPEGIGESLLHSQAAAGSDLPRAYGSYVIQLQEEPVAAFYASLMASDQAQIAGVTALSQAHLASVEQAQLQLVDVLATYEAHVLYRTQRVLNSVAVYMPADQLEAIRALPNVATITPLIPKEPHNARTDALLDAPELWEGLDGIALTGKGIKIAIIDTGIDYLHTMFGGPGAGYQSNNTTITGDAPNFPGIKVVGGFDFVGDTYDASPNSSSFQPIPQPDPDPMDCYSFGHGTHVAGTAAGYGVRATGETYPGPYDSAISLDALRIGPGVAPEAEIIALKVFGCTGSSNVVDAAVEWAVDPNQDGDFSDRVDVINLSLGSSFGAEFDATTIAVENAAKLGIIVVTSAGNTGDVHYAVGSPGVSSHAIAVAATSVTSSAPFVYEDGIIASFSARGPRRGDNSLKPDLAAPGVNIVSARRSSGTQSVTSSGTSMAAPVVAGIMAILRQALPESGAPGWRVEELKALVMNTAVYPLLRPDIAGPYSLMRVGAGRIDPRAALESQLIAYDAAAPERVSVSFGTLDVLDTTTTIRSIRLANKSASPISVTVAYTGVSNMPGVTFDVGAGKIITVPAFGFATTTVRVTADATAMARHADPTRQTIPPNAFPWIDEASGYVSFVPNTGSHPTIHLPIFALPRVVSALSAQSGPIDLSNTITLTVPIAIAGNAPAGIAPTQTVPLMGVFGLAHSSPPITEVPTGDPMINRYAQGDLRYVGVAGPMMVDGERMLYFALVAYGEWSTPLEVTYQIAMDVNNDYLIDYTLQNSEAIGISVLDFSISDNFVSLLGPAGRNRIVQGTLNLYASTEYDTRPFGSNIMVLPLRLDDLGPDVDRILYQVTSTHRDISEADSGEVIEVTPILSLPLNGNAAIRTGQTLPLFPIFAGDTVPALFERAAYNNQRLKGMLLLFLHNELGTRSQVIPIDYDTFSNYLPIIDAQ